MFHAGTQRGRGPSGRRTQLLWWEPLPVVIVIVVEAQIFFQWVLQILEIFIWIGGKLPSF